MSRHNICAIVFATIVSILFTDCSAIENLPSEADARKVFETNHWIVGPGLKEGTMRIASFKKIYGQKGEVLGVQVYTIAFEAEVHDLSNSPRDPMGFTNRIGKFQDTVVFQKTDEGWLGGLSEGAALNAKPILIKR